MTEPDRSDPCVLIGAAIWTLLVLILAIVIVTAI